MSTLYDTLQSLNRGENPTDKEHVNYIEYHTAIVVPPENSFRIPLPEEYRAVRDAAKAAMSQELGSDWTRNLEPDTDKSKEIVDNDPIVNRFAEGTNMEKTKAENGKETT